MEQVYDFGSHTVCAALVTSSEGAAFGETFTALIADVPSSAVEDFRFSAENFQIAQPPEPIIVDVVGVCPACRAGMRPLLQADCQLQCVIFFKFLNDHVFLIE